jgi:hypothetical protein
LYLRSLRNSLKHFWKPTMSDQQFYALWERFAYSSILDKLPDDVEEFCEKVGITIDYYIEEFM